MSGRIYKRQHGRFWLCGYRHRSAVVFNYIQGVLMSRHLPETILGVAPGKPSIVVDEASTMVKDYFFPRRTAP